MAYLLAMVSNLFEHHREGLDLPAHSKISTGIMERFNLHTLLLTTARTPDIVDMKRGDRVFSYFTFCLSAYEGVVMFGRPIAAYCVYRPWKRPLTKSSVQLFNTVEGWHTIHPLEKLRRSI